MMIAAMMAAMILGLGPGDAPPPIDAADLDGKTVKLSDLKGKVVLVDFWATWCAPCKVSLPVYEGFRRKLADKGLVILAISVDEEVDNVRQFVARHELKLRVVHDAGAKIVQRYEPPSMPTAYLIDRSGKLRQVHEGFRSGDAETLENALRALLAEPPPG